MAAPPTTQPAPVGRLPADESAERALLAELGPAFRTYQGAGFTVLSDADPARVGTLLETAAATRADVVHFARRLDLATRAPRSKMRVVFFDAWADFEAHARSAGFHVDEAVPGFFDERSNRCLLLNYAHSRLIRSKQAELRAARKAAERRARKRGGRVRPEIERMRARVRSLRRQIAEYEHLVTRTVVRHEIAHQVLSNLGLQPTGRPSLRWLREGLAMQFESDEPVNRHRLDDFLKVAGRHTGLNLAALVGDPAYLGPGAEDLSARYSIAWALVYDLIHRQPRAFATFVKRTASGTPEKNGPPRAGFEAAFGKPDAAYERGLAARMMALAEEPEP